LAQLLGAYFHQDWMLDDATTEGVIRRFRSEASPERVRRSAEDIARVLASSVNEAELSALLDRLGCHYDPASEGRSARVWLERVGGLLAPAV
jgi:phenylalanyl-tRNA synthetase beta subunit